MSGEGKIGDWDLFVFLENFNQTMWIKQPWEIAVALAVKWKLVWPTKELCYILTHYKSMQLKMKQVFLPKNSSFNKSQGSNRFVGTS